MSGRKRSGAQNRKRKREAEIECKKSSVLLAGFIKKAKIEVEAAANNSSSDSESKDGGYQPPVSEHDIDTNLENFVVSEKNIIQTDTSVCAEKTLKILKTKRSNISTNLLPVTGKLRQKSFLIEKLQIIILMMWFMTY